MHFNQTQRKAKKNESKKVEKQIKVLQELAMLRSVIPNTKTLMPYFA